jgi:hypothetical protein
MMAHVSPMVGHNLHCILVGYAQSNASDMSASTSSFGMSGVNAHMILGPSVMRSYSQNIANNHQTKAWQRMRLHPLSEALLFATKLVNSQAGRSIIESYPFSQATWPLSQYIVHGGTMLNISVLLETSLAAVYKLQDQQLVASLAQVLCESLLLQPRACPAFMPMVAHSS